MAQLTRREMIKAAAASAAWGTFTIAGTKSSGSVIGANDRVRIALVGLNGRGKQHLQGFGQLKNVEIAYLVDPDEHVLRSFQQQVHNRANGKRCQSDKDLRRALEDKNIDAISIAAPNHWHSLMTIWAAQAGKHVYVEKPLSHDIAEGRVAVEAQKKYGVVVQHGTQRRSDPGIAGLHAALKSGKLPRLKIAYGYCCKPRGSIGHKPPGDPPAHLDWKLWKGPAVIDHYHDNYVHYNWHWFWATGNGDLNNQGTHQLDVAAWAIDDDQLHPTRAMAIGGRFMWDDQGQTPNTMFAVAEYPNGQSVMFNVRNVNHEGYKTQVINEYYLEDGSKITGEGSYTLHRPGQPPEKLKLEAGQVTPGGPWGSFIAAVRAGDPTMANGNALDAHRGCVVGHLINNSYRLGSQMPFNAQAGKFGDNRDASEHFLRLHEITSQGAGVPENKAHYTVGPWLTFDPHTEKFTGAHAAAANPLVQDPHNPGFEIPSLKNV